MGTIIAKENTNYGTRNERAGKGISKFRTGKFKGEENPFYGKHHTEETRERWSQIRGIPVLCVETNIIYRSAAEAARQIGIREDGINHCLRGKSRTSGNYHWKYAEEGEKNERIEQ